MKKIWKRLGALLSAAALSLSLLPASALAAGGSRAGGVTIDVTDYGADPTGAKESSTAIIAALAYAKTLDEDEQKTIVFPKGEYHFYEDYSEKRTLYVSNTLRWNERDPYAQKSIGILVEGMKNVTVDGGGSLFIYHGNVCTMAAIDSENVTFTNFSEDFASPEVVDVTVESHEGSNAAILFIPACYNFTVSGTNINWQGEISPTTGQPYWSGNNGFLSYKQYLDTVTGQSMSNGKYPFSDVSSITKIDDTHIKVVYSNAGSRPQVGQCCQMRHPNPRKTPGAFFWQSKDITVSNANFYFLHGFGMVGQLSENITLDTVKCQARPGTGRTSAGFADFVQMSSIAGKVIIRNCEFADPHDDPINVHGTFLKVTNMTTDSEGRPVLTVKYQNHETWGFPQYYVGDKVDFTVQSTLAHVEDSERTVVNVVNPGEGSYPDGTARSKNNENDMKTIIVTLDRALPAGVTATNLVMENVTYTPEVLIENCRFTETPTRAILVTTFKKVVIRNNYFDRIRTSTIFISCDGQDWYESGRTEDVLITGNTFIAQSTAGNDDHYGYSAIIMVWPTNTSNNPNYQIHKNLRIEDNDFYLLDGMPSDKNVISAKSVNGLAIKNNRFLRYTPNVSLSLTAGSTALTAGGTQSTSLTGNGFTLSNKMFRLQACKQVVFEGNTYDDGLNLGIKLDETTITTRDQVTDKDGVLAWNADNQLPAVGQARYFSSDPAVATVDESGVVTGVSAGTAEIYAYRVACGRTFESNHLTFTVAGEAAAKPNKIEITSDKDKDKVDVNGTVNLTATVDPANAGSVAWSVKPASEGAAATITQAGVLTATAPGVVEVTASLGGVTASKLVTVNTPTGGLDTAKWTIDRQNGNAVVNSNNSATITIEKGNDWAASNSSHNLFLTSAPSGDSFEWSVKMSGETCGNGQCWCQAGVLLFADADHYIFAGRKNANGSPVFSVTKELGTSQSDRDEKTCAKISGDVYLKLAKSGTTYTGYYSADATTWTQIGQWENLSVSNFKIGFFADGKDHSSGNSQFTFSDFKITQNGTTTSVPLVSTNVAPTISGDVTAAQGSGTVTLSYTYSDADSDAEDGSLIAWYASDSETGHYTRIEGANTNTLTVTAATSEKWVKAVVVPKDATGRYGAPVTSTAVQAPAQPVVQDDATLATLSVSGLPLTPAFDPTVTAYTVSVPASASKVTVSATATQGNSATVAGTGPVTISGTETTVTITVTAPNGTTTKTYTVTVNRAASNDATLSNITASAGSASITYNAATRFYELTAEQGTESLTFSATPSDPNAKIEVRYNAEEKGEYEGQMTLPLAAGINNLELRVTAEDGISTALYRVRVMKPVSSDATLKSLTVNGEAVAIPTDSTDLGLIQASGDTATLNATVSGSASVYLSVDGKTVENGVSATLTKTLSVATVRVVAEDGVTENVYTLALSKNDPGNADLYLLKLDGMTLSPAFDKDTLSYTATFTDKQGTSALTATATQVGADVTCETVSVYETAKGGVKRDCHFFRDVEENFVKITVTSPDGTATKEYIIDVTYEPVVYLSDLPWQSATSGWKEVRRDYDVDSNKSDRLSLMENGQTVTYEKGLGTHANSTIVYNLSAWDYTHFTAKVGMDHSQASANTTQRLRFDVSVDGVNRYTSGELGSTMNCETVNIDISPDAQELTLHVIYTTGGDANAHADWADAKFSGGSIGPALKETEVFVKYIEFEHEEHTIYVNGTDDAHPSSMELHPVTKPIGVEQSAHTLALDWDSTDDTVATVTDGRVTAYDVGETTVTATAVDKTVTDTCTITVKKLVEGELSVSGDLRYGTQLTVRDTFDPDVKDNVTYTWYRGEGTSGTVLGTGKTYTPVKEDIGQVLTVKAAAKDTATYYEGETAFTTDEIGMEAGHEVDEANLTYQNCTDETAADGKILGLLEGHVYQYQKQNADGSWPDTWIDVPEGDNAITGLAPGSYHIRHAGDDDTREPGEPSNTITISVVGTTEVALTVPQRFVGGVVRANRSQIPVGDTVTLTVTPDKGYELDTLEAKYTDENDAEQTLTPVKGSDGKYTFVMPAFPVTIAATFAKITYTIGHGLEYITCNEEDHQHTATHGETFSIILTPDEGYNMPRTLTVTETGTDKKFTDFTYEAHETDPAKRVLTFPNGVTCDITVSGKGTPKTYTVVYELTNGLTAPGAPQTATHSKELSVTLTAARGYTLPEEITVTVAGAELTAGDYTYNAETGAVTIENVTGNVVITAQGEAQDVPLQSVTLIGPARVGRTLTVNTVPTLATVEYQWIMVDEDGTETDIENATGASYVIPADAEGKTIKVRVTGTGSYDGVLTTDPTDTILAADQPFVFVTGIELDSQEAEVAVGQQITLTATVTPGNATAPALAWSSDNEAIATVDQNGVVTGVAEGTVTITAASTDTIDNVTAQCQVTVTKANTPNPPSSNNSSGSIHTPTSTTTVETRKDGSVVTTVTNPDGTVIETVEQPDGTKSETVTTKDGGTAITVTDPEGGKVEKTVTPEKEVTITVTDVEGVVMAEVALPATIPAPETKFVDVPEDHWAEESINVVAGLGLVNGVGGDRYDMTSPMDRGSLATVLYRLSKGKSGFAMSFTDVPQDKYYAEGVAWAAKAGVVTGFTDQIFAPEQTITREQLAVMLARYAGLIGLNTGAEAAVLKDFADGGETGEWAVKGVAWCVEKGILQGKGGGILDPAAEVSRAEVAVMLQRFIDLIK